MDIVELRYCSICGKPFVYDYGWAETFKKKVSKYFSIDFSKFHSLCSEHKYEEFFREIVKSYIYGLLNEEDLYILGIEEEKILNDIKDDYIKRRIENKGFWAFPYQEYICPNCGLNFGTEYFRYFESCPKCGFKF